MTDRHFEPSVPKNVWGPASWTTFHSLAAAYTADKRDEFLAFIDSFGKLLPCTYCVVNFQKKITEFPPDPYLGNAEDLLFWTYTIHDMANRDITRKYYESQQTGKPFGNTPKSSPPWGMVRRFYLGR
jgi:hypothetical protein